MAARGKLELVSCYNFKGSIMEKLPAITLMAALFFFTGCGSKDAKLVEALNNNADYAAVSALIEKGAKATPEVIRIAEQMVEKSRSNIEKIKSGETSVMGGNNEIMIKQYESEMLHNQMIVDLLRSTM